MNIRQIKLALTVDLLNKPNYEDPVDFALEKMDSYIDFTGGYLGTSEAIASEINETMEHRILSLEYERYTLNMDLIHDRNKNEDYIQTFDFQEN